MGEVYQAEDLETHTLVALKVLRAGSAESLVRFKREFRALQDLQHPNLVSLGELVEEGGFWFFTMELVRGATFVDYVRNGDSAFDESRLRDAFAQLVRGLHALHTAGKVHRDIKPSNVLVSEAGELRLLDFGLVLDTDAAPESRDEVVGTAAYMAPEQAAGETVGPEADWYSAGAVLYEALVGEPPFTGSPLQVLVAKQRSKPAAPRSQNPDVPPDLDRLCSDLLEQDPRARPAGDELLRRLGIEDRSTSTTPRPLSISQDSPFVGRARELEILEEARRATQRRQPVVVRIEGESGVGKTALVRKFSSRLRRVENTVVLAGRCYERESVSYKAFDGVADAIARHMQRLPRSEAATLVPQRAALLPKVFPVLRRVSVFAEAPLQRVVDLQQLRTQVFAAFRELLSLLVARRPVVLSIDDLQWADADSIALLREIVRPPEAPPLLVIAMSRPVDEGDDTTGPGSIELPIPVRRLELRPLGNDEACELASRLLEFATGETTQRSDIISAIATEAGGHPLFIDELVRHTALGTTASSSARAGRSVRLEDALWQRILDLEPNARRLLELLAVAGAPLPADAAAHALDIGYADLRRHLALLRVMNLARTTGARAKDKVDTFHDRVRATVLEHLKADDRLACHTALARGLEASPGADPEALAVHLRAAGQAEKAATYAVEAADQASRALAFDRATRLCRTALEMCAAEDAHAIRIRLGDALANAGRGAEAAETYLAAVATASAAEALDLQRRAAQQLLVTGHTRDGLATLRAVLRSQGMRFPKSTRRALLSVLARRAQLRLRGLRFRVRDASQVPASELARIDVCWHAGIGLSLVDTIRGNAFHARGFILALRAGEPYRLARALAIEGGFLSTSGGPGRARTDAVLARADELAQKLGDDHAIGLVVGCSGVARFLRGEFREGLRLCNEAEEIFRNRCSGVPWELVSAQLFALRSLHHLGEFEELDSRVPRAIRDSRDRGDLFGETSLRATVLPISLLARDKADEATRVARESLDRWASHGFQMQHYYQLYSHCTADLYAGRAGLVAERIDHSWTELSRSMLLRVQFVRLSLFDVRARARLAAAYASGSEAERARLLDAAEKNGRRIAREKMAWSNPLAEIVAACAAATRGDLERAEAGFAAAAEASDAADMALHAAVARRRRGHLLGGEEGRALVVAADDWMRAQKVANPERFADLLAPMPA